MLGYYNPLIELTTKKKIIKIVLNYIKSLQETTFQY